MLRRIGVLASLAVAATMFAGVSTASAQSAGTCVFTGLAGNLKGTAPVTADGIPSAQKDNEDGTLDDIERGTYEYGGPAVCAGVFDGAVITPADSVTITSSGEYQNIVCGTGWASDLDGGQTFVTAATSAAGTGPGAQVTNVGYEIPFVGGNGPLTIGGNQQSTSPDGGTIAGDYTGSGAVHIQPVSPDNCVTTNTDQFTVAGFFSASGP